MGINILKRFKKKGRTTIRVWEAEMASKTSASNKKFFFIFSLFLLCLALLLLNPTLRSNPPRRQDGSQKSAVHYSAIKKPGWFGFIVKEVKGKKRKMNIGFVNLDEAVKLESEMHGLAETITVHFDPVSDERRWEDFFPEWIDEEEKWGPPTCPEIPMPSFENYSDLDVVVARVPCGRGAEGRGVRDVFRLQVNLIVANLMVKSGWVNGDIDRTVHVVFVGGCGPMLEIFRCDDLLIHEADYWIYKPDLRRLKQKVLMPVGSCQLASPYAEPGKRLVYHLLVLCLTINDLPHPEKKKWFSFLKKIKEIKESHL